MRGSVGTKACRPSTRADGTIAPVTAPEPLPPAVTGALEERNALWAQALRARALAHEADERAGLLERRVTSRSWRITAPLRRLSARLQALRR
jgi:hypothetical protein